MAKQKAYPKVLYVKREDEGTDDEFLLCDDDPSVLVEQEITVTVALYRFTEMVSLKNVTSVLKTKPLKGK